MAYLVEVVDIGVVLELALAEALLDLAAPLRAASLDAPLALDQGLEPDRVLGHELAFGQAELELALAFGQPHFVLELDKPEGNSPDLFAVVS